MSTFVTCARKKKKGNFSSSYIAVPSGLVSLWAAIWADKADILRRDAISRLTPSADALRASRLRCSFETVAPDRQMVHWAGMSDKTAPE